MTAEIISVGTELLLGQITDTNATFISTELATIGVDVYFRATVGDNLQRICNLLKESLSRSDIVILTGGIGPTTDDLTREAISEVTGRPLHRDPEGEAHIRGFFERRGIPLIESNLKQACVPEGGELIPNPKGTAPGVYLKHDGRQIFAVPGVPREMVAMIQSWVVPKIAGHTGSQAVLRSRVLRIAGLGESAAARAVEDILLGQSNPTVAPLAGPGEVILRITAKGDSEPQVAELMTETEHRLRERLGPYVYGVDGQSLESRIVEELTAQARTVAVAESCTGGLICDRITNVSGSSNVFPGGVIAYSNEVKEQWLGVRHETLLAHGAVSPEVAEEMASGIREACGANVGLATTGIAGPTGGTPEKPVGLVYVAVATGSGVQVEKHQFTLDREDNKRRMAQAGLWMLYRHIFGIELPPGGPAMLAEKTTTS